MWIREYKLADCEQLAELFYNTVHSINAKDYQAMGIALTNYVMEK